MVRLRFAYMYIEGRGWLSETTIKSQHGWTFNKSANNYHFHGPDWFLTINLLRNVPRRGRHIFWYNLCFAWGDIRVTFGPFKWLAFRKKKSPTTSSGLICLQTCLTTAWQGHRPSHYFLSNVTDGTRSCFSTPPKEYNSVENISTLPKNKKKTEQSYLKYRV